MGTQLKWTKKNSAERREIDSNSLFQGSPKNSIEIIFRISASQHLPAYLIERLWKFRVTDIKQSIPAVPCKTQHEIELFSTEGQMKLFCSEFMHCMSHFISIINWVRSDKTGLCTV